MYHLVNNLADTLGNALAGYYVKLKKADGTYAALYANSEGTPIADVSGVANTAKTDADGMYDFYVDDGDYDVEFYDKDDITSRLKTIPGVPMYGLQANADLAAAVTAAETAQAAAEESVGAVQADLASTDPAKGAALVALTTGRTVAEKLGETISVLDYGAVGDGVTDDAGAFQAAQAAITAAGGGTIVVPWTANGYRIGDGTNAGQSTYTSGITVTSGTHWRGEAGVLLICGALVTDVGNHLFSVRDCSDVSIEGFSFDGQAEASTDQPYVAVAMGGIVENIALRRLVGNNFTNFVIQYADEETDPALAYFRNILIADVLIGGVTGVTGAGSGINIFSRSQIGSAPSSKGLVIVNPVIDVSNGSTNTNLHGPQALKLNNVDGFQIIGADLRGGEVGSIILANGCRNGYVEGGGSLSDLGLVISTESNTVTTRTQSITVGRWDYARDGATGGSAVGLQIGGAIRDVRVLAFDLLDASVRLVSDYANDILLADGLGATWGKLSFGKGTIRNGIFEMVDADDALQPDLDGLSIEDVLVTGGAGSSNGRMTLSPANWTVINGHFRTLRFEKTDNDCVTCNGSNNIFDFISCKDGNPDSDSNAWVVNDIGTNNTYRHIQATGTANNMSQFFNKSGGDGITIGALSGSVTGTSKVRLANQQAAKLVAGPLARQSAEFTLSGAATEAIVFVADRTYAILSVGFIYTEASSADAGVNLDVKADGTSLLTYTSEVSKARGAVVPYQNTDGTAPLFTGRTITAGQALSVASAGGKTGTGKVMAVLWLSPVEG